MNYSISELFKLMCAVVFVLLVFPQITHAVSEQNRHFVEELFHTFLDDPDAIFDQPILTSTGDTNIEIALNLKESATPISDPNAQIWLEKFVGAMEDKLKAINITFAEITSTEKQTIVASLTVPANTKDNHPETEQLSPCRISSAAD